MRKQLPDAFVLWSDQLMLLESIMKQKSLPVYEGQGFQVDCFFEN